jgi:hypothetical protein
MSRVLSRFFDPVGHETTYAPSENKHFLLKVFFKEKKLERFDQSSTLKNDVEDKNVRGGCS